MPCVVTQSRLFGQMFGTDEMRALFDDSAMVARYLEVEVALARAQARLGLIPAKAAEAIARSSDVSNVDWERLSRRTEIVGYPILPLVEQIVEWAPEGLGEYVHWGATTQDIMDTADVLQIRDALDLATAQLDAVASALAKLARDHAETPMPGRTHMQHALPITFGYKAAVWLSGIDRHRERASELRKRVEVVSFSGASGTLASLGGAGLATQAALAKELGLGVPSITWHTVRDGFAEVTGWLALVCGTLGKIGFDIMLMMQTEIGEVLEPYVSGRGSSSTMPQKRNPISSELMVAAATVVRENHSAMLDAMMQDHERATGKWHVEWQALPTAFIVASGSLRAAKEVLEGLDVRTDVMLEGLGYSSGLITAEAVMMGLAPALGRQTAHDLVYACCRKSLEEERLLLDVLKEEESIISILDEAELRRLLDPRNYLGEAPEMVRRLLASRARTDPPRS